MNEHAEMAAPPEEVETIEQVEVTSAILEDVQVGSLVAQEASVTRGAVGGLRAHEAELEQAVVGGVAAEESELGLALVGGVAAREVSLERSLALTVIGRDVTLERSGARSVLGGRVTMGPGSGALIVIAGRVDGEPRSVLGRREGLLAVGLVALLVVLARIAGALGSRGAQRG